MPQKKNYIAGVVIGELRSAKQAKEYAEKTKNCPHLLFHTVKAKTLYSVCAVHKENHWWLKYPEKNPKRVGFKKAKVYLLKELFPPGILSLKRSRRKARIAPCGADCSACDLRNVYKCPGCPATSHYHE